MLTDRVRELWIDAHVVAFYRPQENRSHFASNMRMKTHQAAVDGRADSCQEVLLVVSAVGHEFGPRAASRLVHLHWRRCLASKMSGQAGKTGRRAVH